MKYCTEYAALLDLYVDGELPAEKMAEVQAHLENCAGCRAYVEDALLIRAAFPDVESVEVPEGFAEGVIERIRTNSKEKAGNRKTGRQWLKALVPLAACCALVVLLHNGPATSGGGANTASSTGGGTSFAFQESGTDAGASAYAGADTAEDAAPADMPAGEPAPQMTEGAEEVLIEGREGTPSTAENVDEPGARRSEEAESYMVSTPGVLPTLAAPEEDHAEATEDLFNGAEKKEAVLTLAAGEAGDLLKTWTLEEENEGVRWYKLTEEQYKELLTVLEAEGTDYVNDTSEKTFPKEESIWVKVTGPF